MEYETIERFIHQRCAGYHGMFSYYENIVELSSGSWAVVWTVSATRQDGTIYEYPGYLTERPAMTVENPAREDVP